MKTIIITQERLGYKLGQIITLANQVADYLIFKNIAKEKKDNLFEVNSIRGVKTRAFNRNPNLS